MFTVEQALLFLSGSGYDAQGHARMANEHNRDAERNDDAGAFQRAQASRALAWAHAMLATDDGRDADATCGRMAGEHRTGGAL